MIVKIILVAMMTAFTTAVQGQAKSPFDAKPYFSAVIVNNVDSSGAWYQSVFGLKIKKSP
jgi:hypothetical protein